MPRVSAERLLAVAVTLLRAGGTPDDISEIVAQVVVGADLAGYESHGIQLIPRYMQAVNGGKLIPDARPSIVEETATTALVSGNWGHGHHTAWFATEVAIRKAQESNVAVVGLVETNHMGRLGAYSELAVSRDMAVIVLLGTNTKEGGSTAPYGGRAPALGTNPYSIGVPSSDDYPDVVVDFSTSQIAGNSVKMAEVKGEPLPVGAVLDKHGNPTTNPQDFYDGGVLLPAAGHKGYGLSLCADLLGNVLNPVYLHRGPGREAGMLIIALNPAMFAPLAGYFEGIGAALNRVKSTPLAAGFDEILIPGEGAARRTARHRAEGVELLDATWDSLDECARSLGTSIGERP